MKLLESWPPPRRVFWSCTDWWSEVKSIGGLRNRETGLSFLLKLHRSLSSYSCSYRSARIWACPRAICCFTLYSLRERQGLFIRVVILYIWPGFDGNGGGARDGSGFRHPSSVQPSSLSCCWRLCFEIEGLSVCKTIGPRRDGGSSSRWGLGHNRFYHFNLGESKEVLLLASWRWNSHRDTPLSGHKPIAM